MLAAEGSWRSCTSARDIAGLRGYAICTTGRSGSNFLSQILTSTNSLGRPLEYFNGEGRRQHDWPDYPDHPDLQLAAVLNGRTANGVYGLKLFPRQFLGIQEARWTERLPALSFVLLEREDLLGQALSWARALQTGQYRSTSAKAGSAAYDRALIARQLAELAREQARWRLWFARTGIQPLRLLYEQIVLHPAEAASAVAALVGVEEPVRIDPSAVDVRIQRDEETEAWRRRFVAESGDRADITHEFSIDGVPDPTTLMGKF